MRRRCVHILLITAAAATAGAVDAREPQKPAWVRSAKSARLDDVNQRFLQHVESLAAAHPLEAAAIREAWQREYRDQAALEFVPDALATMYPAFAKALAAFDEDRAADAVRLFEPLLGHGDRFVAANAKYFFARALLALGDYERASAFLDSVDVDDAKVRDFTAFSDHLRFLRGVCQARTLRFDEAAKTLRVLAGGDEAPSEMVRVGARQLSLELERREQGTLGEVASVMDYVADRLHVADTTERVEERQGEIIALLDKLIEQQQQQEQKQQSSSSGGSSGRRGGRQSARGNQSNPAQPKNESDAPGGAGRIGDLHAAPRVRAGEAWGKLPPAERERILQSIRERFPSRYRQLVEQYYRSLAEDR